MGTDIQKIINDNLRRYVHPMSKKNRLTGFNRGSLEAHERKKLEIAFNAYWEGLDVLLEPKLINGKRPDVLILDTIPPRAYEVMASESEQSITDKEAAYLGIKIIRVKI